MFALADEKYGVDFGKLKRRKQLIKQVAISYCAARGPPAGAEEADEEAAEEGDEDAEAPVEGLLLSSSLSLLYRS